jgi:hypothetical protein
VITTNGIWFKDEHGRTLMLRGVNLGGSTKVPFKPDGATYLRQGFFNHREVSFVGRPFPLEQADEHFARLRAWGLTFLRFLITWEAVEHAGPGIYDQEYLDYLHAVIQKAAEHGISLFIDPHQDVWSRFSGGDGAPGWTFEAIGMDITQFHETGAAFLHQILGDPLPRMIWPTNTTKLASATMFTLFFAGNDFAPATKVNGEPVQEYLQRHYIAAIQQVARRLKDLPNVIGYDTLNEPSAGFIGWKDLNALAGLLKLGASPTPFQSMLLGAGYSQNVEVWEIRIASLKMTGRQVLNPQKKSVWLPGHACIWRQNGVWDVSTHGTPVLRRPDHFAKVNGREVDFSQDYYRPFANRFATAIREIVPEALIFVETDPGQLPPDWGEREAKRIVSAPHWYDGMVVIKKDYSPWIGVDMQTARLIVGPGRIRKSFAAQVDRFKQAAIDRLRGVPTLIGEFGIPFDLKHKQSYRSGDFRVQVKAMDRSFRAMEDNLVSCTIWNYTADNTNLRGDLWNDEDFSIFCRDQQINPKDIHSGGRALEAVVRPYARAIAGEPLRMRFDYRHKIFEFEFCHDPAVNTPTEFYIPNYQYPRGYTVEVSDGTYEVDTERQNLLYYHNPESAAHLVKVKPK